MSTLSSHILDTEIGRPAEGIAIVLESALSSDFSQWKSLASGTTNSDGRVKDWSQALELKKGIYRLTFDVKPYFEKSKRKTFYPVVHLTFEIHEENKHYHVPLLISAHGLASYRGS